MHFLSLFVSFRLVSFRFVLFDLVLFCFCQEATIDVGSLEEEFQDIRDPESGERVTTFVYNKGL